MTNVFFVYSQPRKSSKPDHMLYGLNHLKAPIKTSFSNIAFSKLNILKWPISPLQKYFIKHLGIGFQLDQALMLLPQLRKADVIVTTNDTCGLPIALLKKLKLISTPHIYMHINLERVKSSPLHNFAKNLLTYSEKIICLAPDKLKRLNNKFKIHKAKLIYLPPPVDVNYFKPKRVANIYDVLAVGRDLGRDYKTLFKAIKNLNVKVLAICDQKNLFNLKLPSNVTVKYSLDYHQVRKYYHQAKIIVIPTKKNTVSGQINLLETLSCGKAVIATDNPALKNIFSKAPCLYYKSENSNSLRVRINRLIKSPRLLHKLSKYARKSILPFSSEKFAKRLEKIINNL